MSKKEPSRAFLLDVDDWLTDENILNMTPAQEGIYIRLLCFAWREGSIPDDEKLLAHMTRTSVKFFRKQWIVISGRFVKNGDSRLVHPRLERERDEERERRQARVEKARHSAVSRWTPPKQGNAPSMLRASSEHATSTPQASSEHAQAMLENANRREDIALSIESAGGTASPPRAAPTQGKFTDAREQRAREILAVLWAEVQPYVGRDLTLTAWRQRNKAAALDLADGGRTNEEIVAARKRASQRLNEQVIRVEIVRDQLVKETVRTHSMNYPQPRPNTPAAQPAPTRPLTEEERQRSDEARRRAFAKFPSLGAIIGQAAGSDDDDEPNLLET